MVPRIPLLAFSALILVSCGGDKPAEPPKAPDPEPTVADKPVPAVTVTGDRAAFLVDTTATQTAADVRLAAQKLYTQVVAVERLFPDAEPANDPMRLASIYRVIVAGPGPDGTEWDDAYALRDVGSFPRVEPDQLNTLEPQPDPQAAAPMACATDDGTGPDDRGWAPREIRLPAARALIPPAGGKQLGEGIRICHPDTGWTVHVDLDDAQLDQTSGLNLIDGGNNSQDPLGYSGNPGHGTGTGSVLMSGGDLLANGTSAPGVVVGVAPKATLVPIRAIKSVIQVFDSDIAKAVNHAVTARCEVVSMSLGGRGFFGLERALKNAVQKDVIVVSAAGNCVGFVVAPAAYANSIAAAATNINHKPWKGTSKGSAVDISAPGEDVWVAKAGAAEKAGDGTSFATAEVAGAAAVWLAFHGEDRIDQAKQGRTRQAMFLDVLRKSATDPCTLPGAPGGCRWDKNEYGAGILDVEKLLKTDFAASPTALAPEAADDTISVLARMFDTDKARVRTAVAAQLGNPPDLDQKLVEFGPEIIDIATRRPASFRGLLGKPSSPAAFAQPNALAASTVRAAASRRLAAHLQPAP